MKRRDDIPHKRYCEVCQNFDWYGHCTKGWDIINERFCELEDFIPSRRITILNYLEELDEGGAVQIIDLNEGGAQ